MQHRVAVVGIGAVSPLGNDSKTFLDNIFADKVGIAPITHFDATETGINNAAEVKDFDATKRIPKKVSRRMDDYSRYALYSAMEAMEMAGLEKGSYKPEDLGVIYGSGIGGLTTIQEQAIKMHEKGPKRVSPFFVTNSIINMAAGTISINLDARNKSEAVVTACATGNNAIGDAFEHIKSGKAVYMICGGSEASINELGISGFSALTALSDSKDPMRSSMPFDKDRNGFVMGEGAGTLVLEDLEHAKARGANILAEVTGYGSTSDAYHLTSPRPDGSGGMGSMKQAVEESDMKLADVDYINAHGTATPGNDGAESNGIYSLFHEDNDHLLVSSTKGQIGHALGAAGGLEAVISIGAIMRNQMPVNVGMKNKDPEVKVDLVSDDNNKSQDVDFILSNGLGFGGHNATLAFKRVK